MPPGIPPSLQGIVQGTRPAATPTMSTPQLGAKAASGLSITNTPSNFQLKQPGEPGKLS